MSFCLRIIISAMVIFSTSTAYTITYAASYPSGTGSNTSTYSNPASSTNKQKNILNNQDNKTPAVDNAEQKEPNPILYENYQQCYVSLISDVVGKPAQEVDARKATIKKYCRTITNVKYQRKFSDCFNASINSGNDLDVIIKECVLNNEKPAK
jgi:hypothetical protein